jgi:catechol 2,3-dioxygenase-like lactoylglutathione lyase family enzyme
MSGIIARPPASFHPGSGLLRNDHFQVAYTTNDIERACAVFRQRFGIREFRRLEGQLPAGGHIHIELAWAGGTMYELILSSGPGAAFFNAPLPAAGFAIRHHHLGYIVADLAGWEALHEEIRLGGWIVHSNSNNPGFLRACIIEVPELNHYLEFFLLEPAGVAFLEGVPGN